MKTPIREALDIPTPAKAWDWSCRYCNRAGIVVADDGHQAYSRAMLKHDTMTGRECLFTPAVRGYNG